MQKEKPKTKKATKTRKEEMPVRESLTLIQLLSNLALATVKTIIKNRVPHKKSYLSLIRKTQTRNNHYQPSKATPVYNI